MLVAPQYQGIELPFYGPETQVSRWFALAQDMKNSDDPNFLRPISINVPVGMEKEGLDKVLERTDEELTLVSDMCGALVVDHEWGIHKLPKDADRRDYVHNSRESAFLPKGHILVANVDVIRGRKFILLVEDDNYTQMDEGLQQYDRRKPFKLSDMTPGQFMVKNAASDDDPNVRLVDIEPRFQ